MPFDSRADRLPLEFAFAPDMFSARRGPGLREYVCSGYSEMAESVKGGRGGDVRYPVSALDGAPARWAGRFVLSEVGAVGGLVRGRLEYSGRDSIGQERIIRADFAVPKYPDK